MAFSPTKNLLVWTDTAGDLTRWREPIPASAPDPVKLSAATSSVTVSVKRKGSPTLFDDDADVRFNGDKGKEKDTMVEDDLGIDLDNDDWILDDVGALDDDDGEARRIAAEGGIREMGELKCVPNVTLTDQGVSERNKGSASLPARLNANGEQEAILGSVPLYICMYLV